MRTADGPDRAGPRRAPGHADAMRRAAARWEDALAVGLGLLVVAGLVLGWLAGSSAHAAVLERGAAESAGRTAVDAVVQSRTIVVGDYSQAGQQLVAATWTAPDGTPRSGEVSLPGVYDVGDRITVWIGPDGEPRMPPATPADALSVALAAGAMTLVAGTVVVVGAWIAGFRWTARRFARAWEADWATVEPRWSGRHRA